VKHDDVPVLASEPRQELEWPRGDGNRETAWDD
jgi:hypothetical protein